jgi:transposase-like protein
MRKQYSATFKDEMVREILKEEKTLSQVASESGVHPTQLKEWKKIALNGLPELFSQKGQTAEKLAQQHE